MPMDRTTGERIDVPTHIDQCVENIFQTERGQRPMDPNYGTNLIALVDLPTTPEGLATIRGGTADAVIDNEPRPEVTRVTTEANVEGRVEVTVHWDIDERSFTTTSALP